MLKKATRNRSKTPSKMRIDGIFINTKFDSTAGSA